MTRWTSRIAALAIVLGLTVPAVAACSLSTSDGRASTTHPAGPSPIPSTSRAGSTSNPPTPPTSAPAKVSLALARAALAKSLPGNENECVVELPNGFEAVWFDNVGHLRFWKSADGLHWKQDGTSPYYYDPRDADGQHVTADGALLTGMTHATFVLHGIFSGDGSGNAMAYTRAATGWGPLVRPGTPDTRVAGILAVGVRKDTGTLGEDTFRELSLSKGELVESECDSAATVASCGAPGTLVITHWRWDATTQSFRAVQ